jgi:hypothetical protein
MKLNFIVQTCDVVIPNHMADGIDLAEAEVKS